MEGGHDPEPPRDRVVRIVHGDRRQLARAEDLAEAGDVHHDVHPRLDVEGLDQRVVVRRLHLQLGVAEEQGLAAALDPALDHVRGRSQEVALRPRHHEHGAVRGIVCSRASTTFLVS